MEKNEILKKLENLLQEINEIYNKMMDCYLKLVRKNNS